MLRLRPYQQKCLDAIRSEFENGCRRQLISMPTGSGKTVIFAHLIKELKTKALVLAHTNELLQQAKDKIGMIVPGLDVGIVNGTSKEFDHPVIVASIQSARQSETLSRLHSKAFDLVIVDEAHHCGADSYRNVLKTLGFLEENESKLLVGFTATAFRSDGKGLGEVFEKVAYQMTCKEMIQNGYLCRARGIRVATDIDLSKVKKADGDFQTTSLASVMDSLEINRLIVKSYLNKGENRKAICFGVTVQHSHNLAHLFRTNGISAQALYGSMPKSERDGVLEDYRKGHIQVLCNCLLLTEGFDAPDISCVIMGRPTQSRGLYQQMTGRGFRLFPGKNDCLVLDFGDRNHTICDSTVLLQDAESEGHQEEKAKTKEILGTLPVKLNQKLQTAYLDFSLLNENESFNWKKEGDRFVLMGAGNTFLTVISDGEGQFKVLLSNSKSTQEIASKLNFDYAFCAANDWAQENRCLFTISDREADWRELPISEKQLSIFRAKGFRAGINELSRGAASDLIASGALRRRVTSLRRRFG